MYKLLVFDPFNVILNVVKYINLINLLLMQSLRESPLWVYTVCEFWFDVEGEGRTEKCSNGSLVQTQEIKQCCVVSILRVATLHSRTVLLHRQPER